MAHEDCKFEEAKPQLIKLLDDYDNRLNSLYDLVTEVRDMQIDQCDATNLRMDSITSQFNLHLTALGNLQKVFYEKNTKQDVKLQELEVKIEELVKHIDNGWKEDLLNKLMAMIEVTLSSKLETQRLEGEREKITHETTKIRAEGFWKFMLALVGAGSIFYLLIEKLF